MTRKRNASKRGQPRQSANGRRKSGEGPAEAGISDSAASTSAGGEASESSPVRSDGDGPEYAAGNCRVQEGRLASDVEYRPVEWVIADLVPKAALTFVIGQPGAGKSTFGAWLCSQATKPAILPGFEESVETSLLPRLLANQVPMPRCLVLDGRQWLFPADRQILTDRLRRHGCDLCWVDPVDSYLGGGSENDGQVVRPALEALARAANDVPCAIVCARHPGKQAGNLCPGSRAWRAVPRVILQLCVDPGPPVRRYLTLWKDPFSRCVEPREYTLLGEPGEAKRFRLGPCLDAGEAEIMDVTDRVDRWRINQAIALLQALLAESEQESSYVYQVAERERLPDRTVRYAAQRLGVIIRREGVGREHRSLWSLPTPATLADSQCDTPPAPKRRRRGVAQ